MNEKLKKRYKKILLTFTSIAIILTIILPKKLKLDIYKKDSLINNKNYYGTTSLGDIYIGEIEEIKVLMDQKIEGVFVVDERRTEDPNMIILASCDIRNKKQMLEIITLLQMYEEMDPTDWDRTNKAMLNEWVIHNMFYDMDYKLDHTTDVDLNNEDEELFNNKALTLLLRNNLE